MDLRQFVTWSRKQGAFTEIPRSVDPDLELARVINALDGTVVLFRRLSGYRGWRAVSGVCARREHFAAALGCGVSELVDRMSRALAAPGLPPIEESGPCQEVVDGPVALTQLPIPRYHRGDGGPYITAGVAVVKDKHYGRNVAFHRLQLLGERRVVARIVEDRGTHTALSKAYGDLSVAIAIGCPIQVLLAAAMSPEKGVDELGIAHALAGTPLVRCQTSDLEVPADAEIVLEGHFTHDESEEGPFPDLTGTMDIVRRQPVIEIDCVTHRQRPIFHALLPGGLEHKNLMGMPREPTILAAVSKVCRCTGVYVTPGGASWLHAIVQIEKHHPEDGRRAIWAAFRGHSSLKHVVVVDTDVDIFSGPDVEWAIATRFQADRQLVRLLDQPGSSLDPSASHVPGQKSRTAKLGLDATAPLGEGREGFERAAYPPVDVEDYLP
jgi:2,5-furandicarboxylate decarboxylase 1